MDPLTELFAESGQKSSGFQVLEMYFAGTNPYSVVYNPGDTVRFEVDCIGSAVPAVGQRVLVIRNGAGAAYAIPLIVG